MARDRDTSPPRLAFSLPLDPTRLLRARHRIRDYLHAFAVDPETIDGVVLAIEEAMTNAVLHSGATSDLQVDLHFTGADLVTVVCDHGRGFDVSNFKPSMPNDPLSPGGRGLYLISTLMDEMELRCHDGLELRALKRAVLPELDKASHPENGIVDSRALTGRRYRDRRLRLMVEELAEAYAAIDWEYRVIYANAAALRLYRRTPEEVLGRRLWELFPYVEGEPVGQVIRDALELGDSAIVEFESRAAGRWLECRVYPTSSGASLYLRDIEERRRKEAERDRYFQALAESEERFRTLFESMTEGVALHEVERLDGSPVDYRVLEVNQAFESQTGLKVDAVRGLLASEAYGTGEAPYLEHYSAVAASGRPRTFETYFEPMDRHFHITAVSTGQDRFATVFEDITERRRSEREREEFLEALRSSEAKYRSLFDRIDEGFCVIEVLFDEDDRPYDYRFLEANPAFEAQTGLVDAVGKTVLEMVPGHEAHWFDIYGRIARTGVAERFVNSAAALGRVYDVFAFRVADPDQRRVAVLFYDITEREHAETERERLIERLEESRLRFETVVENALVGICVWRGPELVCEVANPAYRVFAPGKEFLGRTYAEVWPEALDPFVAIIKRVMETGEPYYVADVLVQIRRHPDGPLEEASFEISCSRLPPDATGLAGVLNIASETTEHKRVELALRKSEERHRELVENANSAIVNWSSDGTITFLNEYAQQLFGWSAEELIGERVDTLLPDRESTGRDLANLVEDIVTHPKRYASNVNENISKDGRRFWMSWTHRTILDEKGEVAEILAVGNDISELKTAEEALRASEARLRENESKYRAMVETAAEGMVLARPQGPYYFVNQRMAEMLGYPIEEIVGRSSLDFTFDEWRSTVFDAREELGAGDALSGEFKFRRKDGSVLWTHYNASPLFDEQGEHVANLALHTDVTERKIAEEALRASEKRFRGYFEQSLIGMVVTSPERGIVDVNQAYLDLIGYTREELAEKSWPDLTHPDDLASDVAQFERVMAGEIEGYRLEKRFVRKDGNAVDVDMSVRAVRDEKGAVDYFVALFSDITERKRTVERLHESEEKYRELVLNAQAGIYELDFRRRRFASVNDAMCTITGYTREELLAMDPTELLDGDGAQRFQARVAEWLAGREPPPNAEYRIRTRAGATVDANLSVTFTKDEQGDPIGATVVAHDITERKRARESEERLLALMDHNPSLVFFKDEDGRYVYVNRTYQERFIHSEDWRGKTDFDFWSKESAELFRANDADVLGSGPRQFLEDSTDPKGTRYCWLNYKFPFTDAEGRRYVGGIGIDVTARVRAEEALRESEARLRIAKQVTGLGLQDYDLRTGTIEWDERTREIWGVGPKAQITYEVFEAGVHPDDRLAVQAAVEAALDSSPDERHVTSYRVRNAADGSVRQVSASWRVLYEEGQAVRFVGTVEDVSERRRLEDERDALLTRAGEQLSATRALLDAARRLSPSLEREEVLEVSLDLLVQASGRRRVVVSLYDERREELLTEMGTGPWTPLPGTSLSLSTLPPDVRRSIEEGRITAVDYEAPGLPAGCRRHAQKTQTRLVLSVPMVRGEGVVGHIAIDEPAERRDFSQHHIDLVEGIAAEAAAALERARLFEEQKTIATTLQRSFQHEAPELPHLEVGLVEAPAREPALIGGDFWDICELPDKRVMAVIGDVAGKGVAAAGITGTVRATMRAFAQVQGEPAFVLEKTNESLLPLGARGGFVTALVIMIDTARGELTLASAGHPLPIYLTAGSASWLGSGWGPPLGAFVATYSSTRAHLATDDYLVLYTDGVTEARVGLDQFGEDRLVNLVQTLQGRSCCEIAERVRAAAEEHSRHGLRDDLGVMVLRLR